MKRTVTVLASLIVTAWASATVLYDGAKAAPNSAKWGWLYLSFPPKAKLTGPGKVGYVTLDTTVAMNIQAGFGRLTGKLDPKIGFQATWRLRVIQETHADDKQRAGLSVFVLGKDHRGVEIGYWNNRVFIYNDDKAFTPGESADIDTQVKMRTYKLTVKGDSYALSVDGVEKLKGALRNYSWFGFPYNRADSIWYGDDSRRGESISQWASFEIH